MFAPRLKADGARVWFAAQRGNAADSAETAALASEIEANWIIVDGYCFDETYLDRLARCDARVMVVDDNLDYHRYPVNAVLNPNPHGSDLSYPPSNATFCLGSRFTPLRREFRFPRRTRGAALDRAHRLLVTMGGSDPNNLTCAVLRTVGHVLSAGDLQVEVIVGAGYRYLNELNETIDELPFHSIVTQAPGNMAEPMVDADACISASGSTCWELARLRVPTLAIVTAENQRGIAKSLEARGATLVAEGADLVGNKEELRTSIEAVLFDAKLRRRLTERASALTDGEGAGRLVMMMLDEPFRLRNVQSNDRRFVFDLANETESRRNSFSQSEIQWQDHVAWFDHRLADPHSWLFIAVDKNDRPAGYVRFQGEKESEISVAISPDFRGRGWAKKMLQYSCQLRHYVGGRTTVLAFIRPENVASKRSFEGAGFQWVRDESRNGVEAGVYQWTLP